MKTAWCAWFVGAVLICAVPAGAQVVMPEPGREPGLRTNVFGLGVFGGPASGMGLSFRHHLPSVMSYQITGGVIKANDWLSYSLGGEVQFDLARTLESRFFIAAGASTYYSGPSSHNQMASPARLGFGIGAEYGSRSGLHVIGDMLFTYFSDGTLLPLPQIGIFYYFY